MDEAYRTITVHDGNRNGTIPMAQAVIRSMAVAAAKGQARAQTLFTTLLATTEAADAVLHQAAFEKALDYKIAWEKGVRAPGPAWHRRATTDPPSGRYPHQRPHRHGRVSWADDKAGTC